MEKKTGLFHDMLIGSTFFSILFFNLEMLPSSTMNISVYTYIFMSKGSDGNDQPDQHPPISKHRTIFTFFFFLSSFS